MHMLYTVLLSLLLCELHFAASQSRNNDVPERMVLLFDLFNNIVTNCISFEYDFGSGMHLLHSKASVKIFQPVQLLPHSTISQEKKKATFVLRGRKGFNIVGHSDAEVLDLLDCYMELQYAIDTSANASITPSSLWLDSCERINYITRNTMPLPSTHVLPLLSQAIFNETSKYFSFLKYPPKVDSRVLRKLFGWILYSGIVNETNRWDCPV